MINGHIVVVQQQQRADCRGARRGDDQWTPSLPRGAVNALTVAEPDAAMINGHPTIAFCHGCNSKVAEPDAAMINGHPLSPRCHPAPILVAEPDAAMINGHALIFSMLAAIPPRRGARRGDDQWTRSAYVQSGQGWACRGARRGDDQWTRLLL